MLSEFLNNLEIFVGIVAAGVAILLILPRHKKSNNDLTYLIVKYNKQKDTINKQSKSMF